MMISWQTAKSLILSQVKKNNLLSLKSKYGRKVVLVPPYTCVSRRFKGDEGFLIQIGKAKFIDVPMSMIEKLYKASIESNKEYDREIFHATYPGLATHSGTPCYISTIGQNFLKAGLAIQTGRNKFRTTDNYLL